MIDAILAKQLEVAGFSKTKGNGYTVKDVTNKDVYAPSLDEFVDLLKGKKFTLDGEEGKTHAWIAEYNGVQGRGSDPQEAMAQLALILIKGKIV